MTNTAFVARRSLASEGGRGSGKGAKIKGRRQRRSSLWTYRSKSQSCFRTKWPEWSTPRHVLVKALGFRLKETTLGCIGGGLTNSSRAARLTQSPLRPKPALGRHRSTRHRALRDRGQDQHGAVQGGDQGQTPNLERTSGRAITQPFWGTCSITKSSQGER